VITTLVLVDTTVVTGLVITTLVTIVVPVAAVPVVVTGGGAVVNILIDPGPVAETAPLEFRVTALTSHQYTVLYCKVSWEGSALVKVLSE
jgi:hypothetical protein